MTSPPSLSRVNGITPGKLNPTITPSIDPSIAASMACAARAAATVAGVPLITSGAKSDLDQTAAFWPLIAWPI